MKYSVALVSVFVATAFAIPQSTPANPLDIIPKCAQTCALTSVGTSKCSLTDPKIAACLCGDTDFQKAFADCVKNLKTDPCSHEEQCKLYTASKEQCAAANVPATIPEVDGGCAAPGSGSSPTSSEAAAPPAATTTAAAEPEPTTPTEPTTPAETTPAAVPTGNATAPSVPEASSPTYSSNAGTLAAKGGAAVLAVFVAVFAL